MNVKNSKMLQSSYATEPTPSKVPSHSSEFVYRRRSALFMTIVIFIIFGVCSFVRTRLRVITKCHAGI